MSLVDRLAPAAQSWLERAVGSRLAAAVVEFLAFGVKQAAACVFAGSFLALLALSNHLHVPGIARYDVLFLGAIAIQLILILAGLETWREVAVLSLFHAVGMGLELFKTSPAVHSWSYPERSVFHIATVPLYSGFMYAAVASYMMQAWRLLRVEISRFPRFAVALILAAAIYANFFTNHYILDLRWPLALAVLAIFWRTRVHFTAWQHERSMPLALSFALIGFFIWIAENIATFFGAWVYPQQLHRWAIVGPNKISSWTMLVIISVIIVAALKQRFPRRSAQGAVTPRSDARPPG